MELNRRPPTRRTVDHRALAATKSSSRDKRSRRRSVVEGQATHEHARSRPVSSPLPSQRSSVHSPCAAMRGPARPPARSRRALRSQRSRSPDTQRSDRHARQRPVTRPGNESCLAVLDRHVPINGASMHVSCIGAGDTTVVLIAGFTDFGDSRGAVTPPLPTVASVVKRPVRRRHERSTTGASCIIQFPPHVILECTLLGPWSRRRSSGGSASRPGRSAHRHASRTAISSLIGGRASADLWSRICHGWESGARRGQPHVARRRRPCHH